MSDGVDAVLYGADFVDAEQREDEDDWMADVSVTVTAQELSYMLDLAREAAGATSPEQREVAGQELAGLLTELLAALDEFAIPGGAA